VTSICSIVIITSTSAATTVIWRPLFRTTGVSWHAQLQTGDFTGACWQHALASGS